MSNSIKDTVGVVGAKSLPLYEYDGQWKFEAVYEDRVEPLTEFHNDPTGLWGEYTRIINNYREKSLNPQTTDFLLPGAIAIYEDDTAVNLTAGAGPVGTLRGFVDLTSTNPLPTDPIEGFRLTAEFKEEQVSDKVTKLTYKGEFPTSTANGRSTKIRMFGIPQKLSWDSALRQLSTNYKFGIKEDTLLGNSTLMPPNVLLSNEAPNMYPEVHMTVPPGYTFATFVDPWPSSSGRARIATSAVGDGVHSLMDLPYNALAPKVHIQPIVQYKYLAVPGILANRKTATPLATITLPTTTLNWLYTLGSSTFNGKDWIMVTRPDDAFVIDYYDASNGYSHVRTTIPIPRSTEYRSTTLKVSIAATVVDGILYIMEIFRSTTSSDAATYATDKNLYFTHIDINTMAVLQSQKKVNHAAPGLQYSLETDTSYGEYVFSDVFYDAVTNGYMVHTHATYPTFNQMREWGWGWIANADTITDNPKGIMPIGRITGSTYNADSRNSTFWHTRFGAPRSSGQARSSRNITEPMDLVSYHSPTYATQAFTWVDGAVSYAFSPETMRAALVPLTLFKNTILTEAVMPEINKTAAFGLRVTYELTITEV